MIGATLLVQLAKKLGYIIFTVIIINIKNALVLKKYTDFAIKVPVKYYKYLVVFL